jgi:hypothetical protein
MNLLINVHYEVPSIGHRVNIQSTFTSFSVQSDIRFV